MAELGGTFQQARATVIVEAPISVSSRSFAQVLKPSSKPTPAVQPKASGEISTSATPEGQNAKKNTPPSSPKGAMSFYSYQFYTTTDVHTLFREVPRKSRNTSISLDFMIRSEKENDLLRFVHTPVHYIFFSI